MWQQRRPRIDQMHLDAEGGEDGCVLAADHSCPHHGQTGGDLPDLQDRVAVANAFVIEWHVRRAIGRGAGGDQDDFALQLLLAKLVGDCDLCRRDKARLALVSIDGVPAEVLIDSPPFLFQHLVLAIHEVVDGDSLDRQIDGVTKPALAKAGEMQSRLTERLRWNGAR